MTRYHWLAVAFTVTATVLSVTGVALGESSDPPPTPPPTIGEPFVVVRTPVETDPVLVIPVASCEEDEPCWDCHTMGNLICGPLPATR